MALRLALLCGLLAAGTLCAQTPGRNAALTGDTVFQSPGALAAQQRYFETLKRAREMYATELDSAIKATLAGGLLEEANALDGIRKRLESGGSPEIPGPAFKSPRANDAKVRYERGVAATQKLYATELQAPLKTAMAAGQLDEANAINAELRGLAALGAASAPSPAAPSPAAGKPSMSTGLARTNTGLMLTRYARLPTQTGDRYRGYVPYTELGKPLGAAKQVKTLSSWSKDGDENAVVTGFIRIDQPGTYAFRSSSGYDRNELWIDGKIVCKFRDGEGTVSTVELRAGLLPVVSVGYVNSTVEVRVFWKPPGAAELTEIPSTLFSH